MPPVNECAAIDLLRRLISMPPEQRPDEPYDPGWCCTEHARIASLAFSCLGIRSDRGIGTAIFARRDIIPREISRVSPHDFVVLGVPGKREGIFDSSVTFGPIKGIPKAFQKKYPGTLTEWVMDPAPDNHEVDENLKKSDAPFMAIYTPTHYRPTNADELRRSSGTPFGKWLEATVGSQHGIWGKAARIIAQTLVDGEPDNAPRNFLKLGQIDLWRWIDSTPTADDFILSRLSAFGLGA
jgi:hypothetical protein